MPEHIHARSHPDQGLPTIALSSSEQFTPGVTFCPGGSSYPVLQQAQEIVRNLAGVADRRMIGPVRLLLLVERLVRDPVDLALHFAAAHGVITRHRECSSVGSEIRRWKLRPVEQRKRIAIQLRLERWNRT